MVRLRIYGGKKRRGRVDEGNGGYWGRVGGSSSSLRDGRAIHESTKLEEILPKIERSCEPSSLSKQDCNGSLQHFSMLQLSQPV